MRLISIAIVLSMFASNGFANPAESLAKLQSDSSYADLSAIPGVAIDLRYASTNNFTGVNLYGPFNRAFLHVAAAKKLRAAAINLQKARPGFKLLVLDALRPGSVQKELWDKVKGTAMQSYVMNPAKGSIHSFGFAVDITVIDMEGKELDMGTAFDTFDNLSQPKFEEKFVREGRLTDAQLRNRHLLRNAMLDAGFTQLPIEWWHYEAEAADIVRKQYKIIE
jgi:D-alanyl-D-alanine dipeptidase